MNCEDCGKKIPAERLEALPEATTCVRCSTTERVLDADVTAQHQKQRREKRSHATAE